MFLYILMGCVSGSQHTSNADCSVGTPVVPAIRKKLGENDHDIIGVVNGGLLHLSSSPSDEMIKAYASVCVFRHTRP